jgi:hypothetical protein
MPFVVPDGCFALVMPDGKAYAVDYMEIKRALEEGWKAVPEDEYGRIARFRDWLKAKTGVELSMGQADQVAHRATVNYLEVKKNQRDDYARMQTSPSSTDSAPTA